MQGPMSSWEAESGSGPVWATRVRQPSDHQQIHRDKASLRPGWEVSPWVRINEVHSQARHGVAELETGAPTPYLRQGLKALR